MIAEPEANSEKVEQGTTLPRLPTWLPHAVTAASGVVLAALIILNLLTQILPPQAALKLAPWSGRLLARAAEAELAAGHVDRARELALDAVSRKPFDVTAVRVLGMALEKAGEADRADQLVTLAGNWSLRDGPAHVWLFDRRLRQGDYASAFAHADALMRRKIELHGPMFRFMAAAIAADPRALGPVAERLSHEPSWRVPYLNSLTTNPKDLNTAMGLALALQRTSHPTTDEELGKLLSRLVDLRQFKPASDLLIRLGRAPRSSPFDGEFDDRAGPTPFRWTIESGAGGTAEILPDDGAPAGKQNSALRVEYDGYGTPGLIVQFLVLPAGAYRFSGKWRSETPIAAGRLAWTLTCAEDGRVLAQAKQPAAAAESPWTPLAPVAFEVPTTGCDGQWLRLTPDPGERRTTLIAWYDGLRITRTGATGVH